jgi:putative ABC transport system substrate-binding protein
MFTWREEAADGGLIAYGPDVADQYHRAAAYVDKIIKGSKPADMPVEQPTTYHLIINMTTANALGLVIPPSISVGAEVIE